MTDNRATLNIDAIPAVFDHLVAPVRELHALGMSTHAIYERCRPGGPWQRIEPNLVLLTDEPPSRAQRIHAALKVAGKDAVLTGVDALRLHGLSGAKLLSPIHVLLPARRRQPRLVDGVYFDRTHQLPEPLHLKGFPVAPLPRATVDAARRAKVSKHVEDLLAETIYKGKITPATLRDEFDRVGGRGLTLPRRKLAEIDDKVRSMARGWAKRLVQHSGLPMPEWRVPITSRNGIHVATADAWWDEVGLAWEVDSYAFDLSPMDAQAALSRAARLTASGVLVVHTSPSQLREEPARVADLLRSAYARAMARPRPEVNAQCKPPKPTRQPILFPGTLQKTSVSAPSGKQLLLDPTPKPTDSTPPQETPNTAPTQEPPNTAPAQEPPDTTPAQETPATTPAQEAADSPPAEKPVDSNPPQKPHENEQSEKSSETEQPRKDPEPEPTSSTPDRGRPQPTPTPGATEPTPETGTHNKSPNPNHPQPAPEPEPLHKTAEPEPPNNVADPEQHNPTPASTSLHEPAETEPSQPSQPTPEPKTHETPEAEQRQPRPES
jgi:hypothetical protein